MLPNVILEKIQYNPMFFNLRVHPWDKKNKLYLVEIQRVHFNNAKNFFVREGINFSRFSNKKGFFIFL